MILENIFKTFDTFSTLKYISYNLKFSSWKFKEVQYLWNFFYRKKYLKDALNQFKF